MSSNCYYIKEPLKKCDGTVSKYTIKVLVPATGKGTCQHNLKDVKDGDIVEEPCSNDECNIEEYNTGNTSFKNTVLCLIKSFTDTFAKEFSSGPGDCSSDKVMKQNFKIVIGKEADLSGIGPNSESRECTVDIDQKIDATSEKVCSNINQTLSNFEGPQRYSFIVSILNKVISAQPESIKKKTQFIERFKQMMTDVLMISQGTLNSKCSQSISISQDQNVYLIGKIKCNGSKFKFSQEAIVNAYMSCITSPVMDQIVNDPLLKKYYSVSENEDCIYDIETIQPCNGSIIKSKVNIIKPKKGTGTCPYNANQILTTPCTFGNCQVSEWSEWSPCLSNEIQHRTRTIEVQGKDCPNLYQEQNCEYEPIRKRPNSNPKTPKRENIYEDENTSFYKFFELGPSAVDYKNKIITYAFFLFFILVFIYVIFFLQIF